MGWKLSELTELCTIHGTWAGRERSQVPAPKITLTELRKGHDQEAGRSVKNSGWFIGKTVNTSKYF